jgi:antitoxin CptB
MSTDLVGIRQLSKLRWRCRRGLLENDLFIQRFFERHEATLNQTQAAGLLVLMDLSDNDLLDLLLGKTKPQGDLMRDDVRTVLHQMKGPQASSST